MSDHAPDALLLVPRWGATAGSDWYPWLVRRLEEHGSGLAVHVAELQPEPGAPEPEASARSITETMREHGMQAARTIVVGHSVGCQALLRHMSRLGPDERFAGAVYVAGWWDVDEPWETLRPWLEQELDLERLHDAAHRGILLVSDDDPYTADHDQTARQFNRRVGVEVRLVHGGGHFNDDRQPDVLDAIEDLLP